MGTVLYIDSAEMEWMKPAAEWKGKVAQGEPEVRYKLLATGVAGVPTMQVVEYDPGHYEKKHSHPGSELLYIIDGEATIGDRLVRAGTLVYVEKDTEYGPIKGGPSGTRFIRIDVP